MLLSLNIHKSRSINVYMRTLKYEPVWKVKFNQSQQKLSFSKINACFLRPWCRRFVFPTSFRLSRINFSVYQLIRPTSCFENPLCGRAHSAELCDIGKVKEYIAADCYLMFSRTCTTFSPADRGSIYYLRTPLFLSVASGCELACTQKRDLVVGNGEHRARFIVV